MASIKNKLQGSQAVGQASKQAVKRAATEAAMATRSAVTRINNNDRKERKSILRRYKDEMDIALPNIHKYDGLGYSWSKADHHAWIAQQIYDETLPFYEKNVRTSILRTTMKRVASKVLDNYSITDAKGKEVNNFTIDLGGVTTEHVVDDNTYTEAVKQLLLGGTVYLVAYFNEDGQLYFKVKDRYNVRPNPTGWDILYTENGKPKVQRRHLDNNAQPVVDILQKSEKRDVWEIAYTDTIAGEQFDAMDTFGVYPLTIEQFVTTGTLELVLMYSQTWGTIDKEIVLGALQLFADKGYTSTGLIAMQDFYTPVDTPKTSTALEDGGKPLFEVYSPQLRENALQVLRDIIREEIATTLMLDKTSLGIDSNGATATEESIKLSASVDTINMLKKDVERALNTFLVTLSGGLYMVAIERYRVNDMASLVDVVAKAKSAGMISINTGVETIHPDWTEDEIAEEVVRIKLETMQELTPTEDKLAQSLGIIVQSEGVGNGSILQ